MTARTAVRLSALALLPCAAAACGDGTPGARLRHEPRRRLTYELKQHEEAPHPVLGLGGTIDVAATLRLGCLAVDPEGTGEYEAIVEHVTLAAPPETGVAVDTRAGRPVEGDRTGATAVALSLLPRSAIVGIRPDGGVRGARPDPEIAEHVRLWTSSKPVASRRAIFRLAEAMDAGPLVHRWFQPLAALLPPDPHAPHGGEWTARPPAIETPAGPLLATVAMTRRREGDVAVLEGRGTFAPDGAPPKDAPVRLEGATLDLTIEIDAARGVLVSWVETGEFRFRGAADDAFEAPWRHRRELRLVEEEER